MVRLDVLGSGTAMATKNAIKAQSNTMKAERQGKKTLKALACELVMQTHALSKYFEKHHFGDLV